MVQAANLRRRRAIPRVDANCLMKYMGACCQPVSPLEVESKWRSRLLQLSNGASFLCVLDCTILPALTVLLPILLGICSAGTEDHHPHDHNRTLHSHHHHHDHHHEHEHDFLHELGHQAALYFVLPVSGLTMLVNFCLSTNKTTTREDNLLALAVGIWGWFCVFASNSQDEFFGHGMLHRVTNILGCLCLYLSNSSFQQHKKKTGGAWSLCNAFCCAPLSGTDKASFSSGGQPMTATPVKM